MAASTCRRSESVRATRGESTPAPRSKPSSTTYRASISAAIPYHSSSMGGLRAGWLGRRQRPRAVGDLPPDQEEEENAEHQVESAESDEREQHGPGVDGGTASLGGPEQAVHEPGLTA